jgi:hypothetical protein
MLCPTKVIRQGLKMGFIKKGKFAICYYYPILLQIRAKTKQHP